MTEPTSRAVRSGVYLVLGAVMSAGGMVVIRPASLLPGPTAPAAQAAPPAVQSPGNDDHAALARLEQKVDDLARRMERIEDDLNARSPRPR